MDLPPDVMQQLLGSATMDDQERLIMAQLAQAYALRNRPQSQHTTGAGAMFGGVGDLLSQVAGKKQAADLAGQHQQMQQAYIEALRRAAQPQQPPLPQSQGYMPMPGGPVGGP